MKRAVGLVLIGWACLGASSWDGCCPIECEPRSWFAGSWEGAVSALYWKPTNGGFQYAAIGFPGLSRNLDFRSVKPDYQWGVRGYSRFARDGGCSFVEFLGLWLRGDDSGALGGGLFTVPQLRGAVLATGRASQVSARTRQEYWNLDLRLGQILFEGCKFCWNGLGGMRYVNFYLQKHLSYFDAAADEVRLRQDLRYYGLGPEIGLSGVFPLWRCISLQGSGLVMAMVGEDLTRGEQQTLGPGSGLLAGPIIENFAVLRLRFPRATRIVPGFELALSVRAKFCWGLCVVNGELGYEMDHYWNAYNDADLWSTFNGLAIRRSERDVGWAGPYLRVGVGF